MSSKSVLRFFGRKQTHRRANQRQQRRFVPRFEHVESRRLLAAYVVDLAGSGDFSTIQDAIDVATANGGQDDVIQIKPGTYVENLLIPAQDGRLEIQGLPGTGPAGEEAVYIDGSSGVEGLSTIATQPHLNGYIALRDLQVTGGYHGIEQMGTVAPVENTLVVERVHSYGNDVGGLASSYSGDLIVNNSRFDNNGDHGIYNYQIASVSINNVWSHWNGGDGIYSELVNDVSISNSNFNDNNSEGLYSSEVDRLFVTASVFRNNIDNGIDLRHVSDVSIYGAQVTNNGTRSNGGLVAGIFSYYSDVVSITQSVLSGNTATGAGIFNTSQAVQISGVSARNNNRAGIRIGNAQLESAGTNQMVATIEDSRFQWNLYRGLSIESVSDATVSNSIIADNGSVSNSEAIPGGGIRFLGDGDLTVLTSQITDNFAIGAGGGIYVQGSQGELAEPGNGHVNIHQTDISGNTATTLGGGLSVATASLLLDQSTIAGNTGGTAVVGSGGGGIWLSSTETDIVNTTISGNTTPGEGGGISSLSGHLPLRIVNSTITGNEVGRTPTGAPQSGGGMYIWSGTTLVLNTIFEGNTAPGASLQTRSPSDVDDPNDSVFSLGNNLVSDSGAAAIFTGPGDVVGISALLGPLQENGGATRTHALLPGSPAVDAAAPNAQNSAPNLAVPTHDQRGFIRPGFWGKDIGAYENQGPLANPDFTSTDEDVSVLIDILANDIDPDGDSLEIERIVNIIGGSVVEHPDATITFTPDPNFTGEARFSYIAQDTFGRQSRTSVLIEVNAVNDAPSVSDQSFTVDENAEAGTAIGTVTASDVEGDDLSFTITSGNESGAFAIDGSGNITVADSSPLDFETTPEFTLQVAVSDGNLTSTAIVTVSLNDLVEVVAASIDIQPGDDNNAVSLKRGIVEVAIFTTDGLDATQIDIDSLRFGATGIEDSLRRHKKHLTPQIRYEDINGDGQLDLIASFDVTQTGLTADHTEATLNGSTLGGESFAASQTITISQNGRKQGGGSGKGKNK
tara:strand:+ start:11444 stop:14500 length:3057 start_codon:yes stop_codon:yes gene_type:complete